MRTGLSQGQTLPGLATPSVVPGLLFCFGLALLGLLLSRFIGLTLMDMPKSPVSPTVIDEDGSTTAPLAWAIGDRKIVEGQVLRRIAKPGGGLGRQAIKAAGLNDGRRLWSRVVIAWQGENGQVFTKKSRAQRYKVTCLTAKNDVLKPNGIPSIQIRQ